MLMKDYFCGWYFRCQSEDQTIALIPAIHTAGGETRGSIQLISKDGRWNVTFPAGEVKMDRSRPRAVLGRNTFRENRLQIMIRTDGLIAEGELQFGDLSPIRYDIMGPFRYVPFLECRHSVISMRHTVNGSLRINDMEYHFQNGVGYIEGDQGCSFPEQYLWTQCLFAEGSLMLSVAEIPLKAMRFTGIICVIRLNGKEYRLATYLGARVVRIGDGIAVIRQGSLTLTAELLEKGGYLLRAPSHGAMTRLISENAACHARYRLESHGRTIWSYEAKNAAFEFEYKDDKRG